MRHREVKYVTAGAARNDDNARVFRRRESLDEQVRRRGLKPVHNAADLARDDVFETDEELDAFLTWVHAERQANLA
jgi:hypothetical protein